MKRTFLTVLACLTGLFIISRNPLLAETADFSSVPSSSVTDRVEIEPDLPPQPRQSSAHKPASRDSSNEHVHGEAAETADSLHDETGHGDLSEEPGGHRTGEIKDQPEFVLSLISDEPTTSGERSVCVIKVDALDRHLNTKPVRDVTVWWKNPDGGTFSFSLRPLDEKSWVNRAELGDSREGEARLTLVVLFDGGETDGEVVQQFYSVQLPAMTVNREATKILTADSADAEHPAAFAGERETTAPLPARTASHNVMTFDHIKKPVQPRPRSWTLIALLVFILNVIAGFVAGIAFAIHKRVPRHLLDRFFGRLVVSKGLSDARALLTQEHEIPVPVPVHSEPAAAQTQTHMPETGDVSEQSDQPTGFVGRMGVPGPENGGTADDAGEQPVTAAESARAVMEQTQMLGDESDDSPPASAASGDVSDPDESVSIDDPAAAAETSENHSASGTSGDPLTSPEMIATERLLQNLKKTLTMAKDGSSSEPLLIRNNEEILPVGKGETHEPEEENSESAAAQEQLPEPRPAAVAADDEKIDFNNLNF